MQSNKTNEPQVSRGLEIDVKSFTKEVCEENDGLC